MAEATVNSDGHRLDVDPSFTHHYYNPRHYEQGAMILTFCHGFFCQAQFLPVLSKKNYCAIFVVFFRALLTPPRFHTFFIFILHLTLVWFDHIQFNGKRL